MGISWGSVIGIVVIRVWNGDAGQLATGHQQESPVSVTHPDQAHA